MPMSPPEALAEIQKPRLVVVHVVQDRRGTCTTEIPQAVDEHGRLRSTIDSGKRPIRCTHLYLARQGSQASIYCQGEGRGFESRRPLQRKSKSRPCEGLKLASRGASRGAVHHICTTSAELFRRSRLVNHCFHQ